jgi:hypothetical protein
MTVRRFRTDRGYGPGPGRQRAGSAAADRLTEAAATFAALGEPGSEAFALAVLAQS